MPYIIAATDFSDTANNALHYACNLATDCNASLKVVHSFMIPVNFNENPMPVMPLEDGKELAEQRMNGLIKEYQQSYPNLFITSQVTYGDIVDSLQEMVSEEKPLMVVLGNDGANDDLMWLGSNVVSAMRHVKVPILGIPTDYTYRTVKKLCYACDFKNNHDASMAEDFKHLLNITNSQLHILYIDKSTNESSEEQQLNMEDSELHKSLKDVEPLYHFVEKDSIDRGVEEFITENDMDWLVIVPHRHSFFESIFKKSHTKSLAKKIHIPLVALHEQQL